MSNMSYCRFKNTSQDLGDCLDAIENNELNDLADFEYDGMRDLLELCEAILEHQEILEEVIDDNR